MTDLPHAKAFTAEDRLRLHTHDPETFTFDISDALSLEEELDELRDAHTRALVEAKEQGAQEKEAEIAALLKDPAAVRVNYLRGDIACQPLIDEAEARGIERAAKVLEEGYEMDVAIPYYEDGNPSKHDQCSHDKYHWEDCEGCALAAIRKLMEQDNAG